MPRDLTITNTPTGTNIAPAVGHPNIAYNTGGTTTDAYVTPGQIQALSGLDQIDLQTTRDLAETSNVTLGAGVSIGLEAGRNVSIAPGVTLQAPGEVALVAAFRSLPGFDGAGAVSVSGSVTSTGANVLLQAGTGGVVVSGAVSTATGLQVITDGASTISGSVSGAGALTYEGAGTLTLSAANTYTGGTMVFAGTVIAASDDGMGNANALGVGAVTLNNGALSLVTGANVANALMVQAGGGTLNVSSFDTNLNGRISGSGALTIDVTPSTFFLRGDDSGFTGPLTLGQGAVVTAALNALPANSALTVASDALLDLNGTAQTAASLSGAGRVTSAGPGAASLTTGGAGLSTTFSGVINDGGPGDTVSLTKVGAGVFTLTGANTYTGGTTVSAGALQIGNGGTTGSITGNVMDNAVLEFSRSNASTFAGVISGSGAVRVDGGGTLTLSNTDTYSGGTMVTGGATLVAAHADMNGILVADSLGSGAVTLNGGSLTFSTPNVDVSGQNAISVLGAGNRLTLSSANGGAATLNATLSGAGALTAAVSGTLVLSTAIGGNSGFTGSFTLASGTLQSYRGSDLSAAAVTLNTGSTYDLGQGDGASVGSLAGGGAVNSASGGGAHGLSAGGNGSSTTFSGVISNGAGTVSLTKTGAGVLTLTGADTYTGATAVSGGVLAVDGSLTSAITVQSGATLRGGGTNAAGVTVAAGGTFAPGEATGMFHASTLSLAGGATFAETITGANANGQAAIASTAALAGTLTLNYTGGVEAYGTVYTVVTATLVTGTFGNTTVSSNGHTFAVNYTTTSVTLTDVTDTAPTVTVGQSFTAPENQTAVGQVTAFDPDAGDRVASYALAGAGADNALFNLSATGLLSFKAAPDYEGAHGTTYAVTVQATDSRGAMSAPTAVTVQVSDVNEAPVLAGSGAAAAVGDSAAVRPLAAVTLTDQDQGGAQAQTATVSFTAANGALAGLGAATVANGVATYMTTGSPAAVQAALQGAVFTPTANQVAPGQSVQTTFTVTDRDSGGLASAPATVTLQATSVNDTPAVAGTHASTTSDRAADALFSGVTVTDPDTGQTETATISFAAADGVLTGATLASTSNGVATYTLQAASASALGDALHGVGFVPATQAAGAANTSTTVSLSVSDGTAASPADMATVVTATHTTNTPPTIGGVPAAVTAPSGGSVVLASALTVSDPDAGASVTAASVSVGAGFTAGDSLTAAATPAGVGATYNAATGVLTLTGSASDAAYAMALEAVSFSHNGAVSAGSRIVTFSVTDNAGVASSTASETVSVTAYSPPTTIAPAPVPLDVQQGFMTQLDNLLRAGPTDVALQAPKSPLFAQAQAEKGLAAQLDNGQLTLADAQAALYHLVDGTTSVAEISYAFFTGKTPTAAGLNYLVHSDANTTDLNDPYYAQFSTENRYINFANNLSTGQGAGAAAFQATFGALSLTDATTQAYAAIFGTTPTADKIAAILNAQVSNGLGGTETRAQYFADITGGSATSQKAGVIGFLLADSVKEGFGAYQQADLHFLADLAHGTAAFNADLLAAYAQAPNLVGQPMLDPTLGS